MMRTIREGEGIMMEGGQRDKGREELELLFWCVFLHPKLSDDDFRDSERERGGFVLWCHGRVSRFKAALL